MDFCHLSNKYEKNLLDKATKTGLDALKSSKKIIDNTPEATR